MTVHGIRKPHACKIITVCIMAAVKSSIMIIPKENTVSPVWTYFGLIAGDDGRTIFKETAVCRICKKSVTTKGGNTSNLFSHLKNHHSNKYAELSQTVATNRSPSRTSNKQPGSKPSTSVASGQQTIQDAVQKLKSYKRNGKKWEELTDFVTSCICKDMLPINIVEKEGFRQMLKKFDSRHEVPSHKYFSQTAIPNKKEGCMRVKQHQLLCCHY